ncbi:MAG: BMC domain-containing protein [Clostridia bacterium]|nr:BMC domain-containing protein [Clostridia bacterium]
MESIGLLEVKGLIASIEGLDAMTKAADVRVIHTEKRLGGALVTIIVAGNVSAVTAAVAAGSKKASKLGKVFGCEVIASPHEEVTKFFDMEK